MGATVKIVIADDDLVVARVVSRVVATLDYCPIICSDGLRALHVVEDNPDVRLLITDVSMPVMDGKQLVQEVRQRPASKGLPIIITSGYARVAEISYLMETGLTCYLGKPIEVDELRSYVKSLVNRSSGALRG